MSVSGCGRRALVASVAVMALAGARAYAQAHWSDIVDPARNDLPNPNPVVIKNWAQLPDGRTWGTTSGVAIGPDGQVWGIDRCGGGSCGGSNSNVAPILKFDRSSGKVLKSLGAGIFLFPHGLYVDRDGNVWVTDARAATEEEIKKFPGDKGKGHTVVKFNSDGRVLLTLGTPGVAGDPSGAFNGAFNEPAAVTTAPNGDIFVADGHSGQYETAGRPSVARIVKFTKEGKFVKEWGRLGFAPGEFRTPHALAFDSRGRLFVADRGNNRIQIFDQEGKFLDQWWQFSRVSGLFIDRNDTLYAIDSESADPSHPSWKRGIRIGTTKEDKVVAFIPPHESDQPQHGVAGEGVAVDSEGNVYSAEGAEPLNIGARGLTKYVKR